jgi:hypothetical protein
MKLKSVWVVLALVVVATGMAAAAATGSFSARPGNEFTATLNVRQEVPRPRGTKRGASGQFTGKLVRRADREFLDWRLTYRRLSGRALQAHIHYGKPGKAGPIAVTLCTRCGRGSVAGQALMATRRAVFALRSGAVYVNIHTPKNPKGEIRGNIRRVG